MRPDPGPTSLVTTDQTVDDGNLALCPRIDHSRQYWVNTHTGETRADSCRSNTCPVCVVSNARRKARILSWGEPERYAVLTQAPQDWQRLRQKMRDLPRLLERRGYRWAQAWTVEINPRATGLHVNVLQLGSFVPQAELQDVWGSIVHIQKVGKADAVSGYVLKDAARVAGYTLKDVQGSAGASAVSDHLRANGGRLAHLSRDYFRVNADTGKPYTQAEVWSELRRDPEPGWMLVLP